MDCVMKLLKSKLIPVLILSLIFISVGSVGNASNKVIQGPSGTIEVSGAEPVPVATTLYGQNYWCWNKYGGMVRGTENPVKTLHLNVLRAGGYNNDAQSSFEFDPFTQKEVDKFITYCRTVGAEPILQVSLLKNVRNEPATAQDAADWVTYCNITKKYNIKYWEIGNEPDIYAGKDKQSYTLTDFCNDFKSFSRAMKAVDPTIQIMGPELAWKFYPLTGDAEWMKTLDSIFNAYGPGAVKQLIAQNSVTDWLTPFLQDCKGYYDIISIHYYPLPGNNCTITNAFNNAPNFRSIIRNIRKNMNNLGLNDVPLAITETNITADWNPNICMQASPPTYYCSLWVADSLGVALEEGLWTMAYWTICENEYSGLGFFDSFHKPRPNYYALQMYSTHFGTRIIHPISVPDGFSVYASRSAENNRTVLMVINKNNTINHETIKLTGVATSLGDREYDFPAYSLTCLEIPDDNGPMRIWSYTKKLADKRLPPEQIQ